MHAEMKRIILRDNNAAMLKVEDSLLDPMQCNWSGRIQRREYSEI